MKLENQLNEIETELLNTWFKSNIRKDFRYFQLFVRISKLSYLSSTLSEYKRDLEIASIMTFIERHFHVPMLQINVDNWLQEDKNNPFIFKIYKTLSNFRTLL